MKLALILLCLMAFMAAGVNSIEIPPPCFLRFGRATSQLHGHKKTTNHRLQGTCDAGYCCIKKRCTKKCPRT